MRTFFSGEGEWDPPRFYTDWNTLTFSNLLGQLPIIISLRSWSSHSLRRLEKWKMFLNGKKKRSIRLNYWRIRFRLSLERLLNVKKNKWLNLRMIYRLYRLILWIWRMNFRVISTLSRICFNKLLTKNEFLFIN